MAYSFQSPLPLTPSLLGGAFIGLGLTRLFVPQKAYQLFGLPLPLSQPSKSQADPSPLLYANAGRDLTLGLAFFIFAWQRNTAAAQGLVFACTVAAEVDAYVVWAFGGSEYGGWHGKWSGHAIGGFALGIIAWNNWGF